MYIYYKGIIQRFAEKKSVLQEIYYRYGKMFACAISLCGYVLREANRIVYDLEDDLEDINNQYIFDGNGYELTLLYEPYIWVNKINDGINLYSTG